MNSTRLIFCFAFLYSIPFFGQNAELTGEMKKFHKISLTWSGEIANEEARTFKDYRLNISFTSPSGKTYVVPGYFAADGQASETSATNGNKWRCHFTPLEIGSWSYQASYRTADNIAISLDPNMGTPVSSIDGDSGTFTITETDKIGVDFRAKGKLEYVGEHFLRWTNQEYFLKLGANSPEVFLEYNDFDNTPTNTNPGFIERDYAAHIPDWATGNPTWKSQKGKGIIGAINYLSSQGLNGHSFFTDSSFGKSDTVFPWVTKEEHYIYDISKLDQWQIVFDHMMKKGLMVQMILSEAGNQSVFELFNDFEGDVNFANARKIYYRELVARFGYLNAITWNLGEGNGWNRPNDPYGRGLTNGQQIVFSDYLKELLYYNDNIVLQNGHANTDKVFTNLTGANNFTGASLQGIANNIERSHAGVLKWKAKSKNDNKKWVVSYDRPFDFGLNEPALFREKSLWSAITAGASGFEFNVTSAERLLQDYSAYETYWKNLKYVKDLLTDNNIPFQEMESKDELVSAGWCLGKDFEVYVIYLKNEGSTTIDIVGEYEVKWYDPRNGGALLDGTVVEISSGTDISLGLPPNSPELDWVVVLQSIQNDPIPVSGITLNPSETTLRLGLTFQLTAEVAPLNATNTAHTFSSSNTEVATVSIDGLVTANAIGSTTITVTTDDGNLTANTIISVKDGVDFCSASGTILMERYDANAGSDIQSLVNSPTFPDNPSSSMELTDFEIPANVADAYGARVSGYICAPETGTYFFWVAGDDQTQLNLSLNNDPQAASTIAFQNQASFAQEWDRYATQKSVGIDLIIGEAYYIEALVKENRYADHLAVGWRKPSDGPGNLPTEIIPGRVLSPNLESTAPNPNQVIGVQITPSQVTLQSGTTRLLEANVLPALAENKTVAWRSSNTAIATIDATGLVTAVSVGNAMITVHTEEGGYTANATITVTEAEKVTGVSINSALAELETGQTVLLDAIVFPTTATNIAVRWTSSDPSIATVDESGLVTAISEGIAIITATTEDGSHRATIAISVSVPVVVTGISISPNELLLQVGNTTVLTSTLTPEAVTNITVNWSSSDSSVALVDQNGMVTAISIGEAVITATYEDGGFTSSSTIIIEEASLNSNGEFIIFPNPASDVLNVKMPSEDRILKFEIYDSTGRLVLDVEKDDFFVFDNTIRVSVLALQNSLYTIHILTDTLEIVKIRFMVKK